MNIFSQTRILFLLLFCFNSTLMASEAVSDKAIHWHTWSDASFALAEQQNKLVLLDISAPWCQFCKKMKAVTYTDKDVIKIINDNYIAIHADIESTAVVNALYGDFGVPGTVLLNADQTEINKRLGYIPPLQMQWHLLGSLQDNASNQPLTNNLSQTHTQ